MASHNELGKEAEQMAGKLSYTKRLYDPSLQLAAFTL
jgi:hypothetical protein